LVFSRRQTSKPSIPGIMMSRTTMSQAPSWQIARASGPLPAVKTSKYSALRRASSSLTFGGMSSTTRMRAVISSLVPQKEVDRLEELHDGDRLGEIGLAAALPHLLLVALHGEGGHRDHRNRAQFLVILEPLSHL